MIVDGFKEKIDFQPADKSEILQAHNEQMERNLKQKGIKQKNFRIQYLIENKHNRKQINYRKY